MLMKMCTKSLFLKGLDIDEDVRHITNFKTNWKRNGRELKKMVEYTWLMFWLMKEKLNKILPLTKSMQ